MWFAELFAELLLLFEDLKFWKKKRARRKYEKENNLPKKQMWLYPSQKVEILAVAVIGVLVVILYVLFFRNIDEKRTKDKLLEVAEILEREKKTIGIYPYALTQIIRNNPLYQDITKDSWGNEFHYTTSGNGETYLLFSSGKDGIPNTDDDIKLDVLP
ncbi:type II secretion system protein GspG [Winogradskyella flava]|uniref:type II secretion system protein GspG n=1 Tax=Winogradskyella flava TaxID=1884876 RepID=UPI00249038A6|nr:type II secretion system protein GspG [Winogradskyella flava]